MTTKIDKTMVLAGFMGLIALAAVPAKADIYTFSVDTCTGSCGPISSGTVTVTQDTPLHGLSTVRIDVEFNPNSGYGFLATGAGNDDSFFFNILNTPTIAVDFITTGWTLNSAIGNFGHSGSSSTPLTGFDYALDCNGAHGACAGHGGSSTAPAPLIFDVTAPGLTPASFKELDKKGDAYFAADVQDNNAGRGSGNTGLIGATLTSSGLSPVPEPASVALLGGILLVSGLKLRRRKA